MSGKLLLDWSHDSIREVAKKRYFGNQEYIRNMHAEIANLFFSEFCENEESADNEEHKAPDTSKLKSPATKIPTHKF